MHLLVLHLHSQKKKKKKTNGTKHIWHIHEQVAWAFLTIGMFDLLACLLVLFVQLYFTLLYWHHQPGFLLAFFLSFSLSHFYCFALRRFFVFPYFCKSMLPQWVHTRQITTHDWLICMDFFSKNTVNDLELSSSVWTLWSNNNQYFFFVEKRKIREKSKWSRYIFIFAAVDKIRLTIVHSGFNFFLFQTLYCLVIKSFDAQQKKNNFLVTDNSLQIF